MSLRMERVSRYNAPQFFDDIRDPTRTRAVDPRIIYELIERAYAFPIEIGTTYADKQRNKDRYAAEVEARCIVGLYGRYE